MLFNPANRNANVTQPDRRFSESSLNQVRPRLNIAAMSSLNKFSRDRPPFFLSFFHGDAIEAVTRVEHKYNQCLSDLWIEIYPNLSLFHFPPRSFETVKTVDFVEFCLKLFIPSSAWLGSTRIFERWDVNWIVKKWNDNKRRRRKKWKISSDSDKLFTARGKYCGNRRYSGWEWNVERTKRAGHRWKFRPFQLNNLATRERSQFSRAYTSARAYTHFYPIFPCGSFRARPFLRSVQILEICTKYSCSRRETETRAEHCLPRIDLAPFRIILRERTSKKKEKKEKVASR